MNPISYTKAGPGECVVEVGHRTRGDRLAVWRDPSDGCEMCDRHRRQYDERDDLGGRTWQRITAGSTDDNR